MVDAALADRLAGVDARIADAARAASRDPSGITRIVVTKFQPAQLVRDLVALGVADVGESRHQEAAAKVAEVDAPGLTWHFIGQLQSNKARAVRRYARVIHSLDRDSVVRALAADDAEVDGLIEVDLSGERGRGGVHPDELPALVDSVLATPGIALAGLMTVAPLGVEPARAFATLRELGERVRAVAPAASALSMGMSGDFAEAVREGATHLRIGTAITGNRPAQR